MPYITNPKFTGASDSPPAAATLSLRLGFVTGWLRTIGTRQVHLERSTGQRTCAGNQRNNNQLTQRLSPLSEANANVSWFSAKWRVAVPGYLVFRPFGAGGSQGLRVYRSDELGRDGKGCGAVLTHPDVIVAMSPPGYPSARLLPSRAGFRFTRPNQFSATVEESPGRSDRWTNAS